MFDAVVRFMTEEVGRYGYAAVFVLMLIQAVCIPIPSEVTLLFGGALASAAFAGHGNELSLVWVAVWGTAGNVVGSWIAYGIGYAGGRPLIDRWGRYLLLTPHEIERAHEWFARRGEAAVLIARLVPVLRTFISLPAGVARMGFGRFTIYTTIGCAIWSFAFVAAGYWLGASWHQIESIVRPFSVALALLFALGVAWWIWRRVRAVRGAGVSPASEPDAAPRPERDSSRRPG